MGADRIQIEPLLGVADLSGSVAWLENCLQDEVKRWNVEVALRQAAEVTAAEANDKVVALDSEVAQLRRSLSEKDYALYKAEARAAAFERALVQSRGEAYALLGDAKEGDCVKEQAHTLGYACADDGPRMRAIKSIFGGQLTTCPGASSIRSSLIQFDFVGGPSAKEAAAVAASEASLNVLGAQGTGASKAEPAPAAGMLCGAEPIGECPIKVTECTEKSEGVRLTRNFQSGIDLAVSEVEYLGVEDKRQSQRSPFRGGSAAGRTRTRSPKTAAGRDDVDGGAAGERKEDPNERDSRCQQKKAKQTVINTSRAGTVNSVQRQCKRTLVEIGTMSRPPKRPCGTRVGVDLLQTSGGANVGGQGAHRGPVQKAGRGKSKSKQPKGRGDSAQTSSSAAAGSVDHGEGSSTKQGPALALLKVGRKLAADWVTEENARKVFSLLKEGFQANKDPDGHAKTYAAATIRWLPHFVRFLLYHTKPVDHHFRGSTSLQLIRAYAKWSQKPGAKLQQYTWKGESFAEEVAPFERDFLQTQVTQIVLKGVLGFGEPNMVNGQQANREKLESGRYFRLGLI